ncbi:CRISPR-associated protein Cas4 [Clostridium botulinum]|uniref:CRISPR-associated protein Cas4 n=1 Tax=Clostridium botulinum TaxID=1491 RepID=UPI00071757C3|nr:CRISPR-associated protein Cas4 [Clostridium botulinum]KRU23805.1 CRISPR-associated protein Cas4 [Clostridium sporogenes]KRU26498.1 CRISPR-associated protein Cas4 [Clostridium sporogenes]KRU28547.1 CRISPR-associated protein Cas4 [Clostridium sporogenes]KRU44089.1 CRISPR-associated protein Cas4 [Clostridium sporogenes]MBZ1331054.1 CRISPR-associated protein Cas4 [Clostridium botulinum]
MKITGTLINYYFHCKRQCWLLGNRINLEDNSEDVHIGRVLHEINSEGKKNREIAIENIKVDKITDEYVVELKKSDADVEASKWQLLLYLKILKDKGVARKGRLEFVEKNKQNRKTFNVELNEEKKVELGKLINQIESLIDNDKAPEPINENTCKKCAYYEYCYI